MRDSLLRLIGEIRERLDEIERVLEAPAAAPPAAAPSAPTEAAGAAPGPAVPDLRLDAPPDVSADEIERLLES